MDAPRAELLGQSLAAVIVSERAETKVSTWRNRLLQPAELPVQAAADPLPLWRWLLIDRDVFRVSTARCGHLVESCRLGRSSRRFASWGKPAVTGGRRRTRSASGAAPRGRRARAGRRAGSGSRRSGSSS